MSQVTAIRPQKNKDFVNIFLDHRFAFSLSLVDAQLAKLKVGSSPSPSQMDDLRQSGQMVKMFNRAANYLARRPHSQLEVRTFLERKFSHPPEKVNTVLLEKVLGRLRNLALVDDESFARWWFEQRSSSQQARGLVSIRQELRRKGVGADLIKKVFSQGKATDWRSLAASMVAKKRKAYQTLDRRRQRQRLLGLLLRRGFETELALSVVDEALRGG